MVVGRDRQRRNKWKTRPVRQDIHTSGIPVLCISCEARHRGICGALEPVQLVELARASTKHVLEEGAELIGDAEPIDTYANILSGVVKLTKSLPDGRQQIVGLQFAPDFLGRPFSEESAIGVEAATPVSLCSFPRRTIQRLIEDTPGLERRLLMQTLRELDEARGWMMTVGRKTAAEKVASFLLLIARNIDPALGEEVAPAAAFDLPLTRADIGDFLGLTIETVSRQLTRLGRDGLISVKGRRVELLDMGRLADLAGA